ncbi:MAG: PSD1 and planctomycete cytochrome C domain-containing protein [Bryobacteraceae bacterium]
MSRSFLRAGLVFFSLIPACLHAAGRSGEELFVESVQPLFKQQCFGCHGEGNTFGQLDLRTREAMLKGGRRGPAVVPGDSAASLLLRVLDHTGEIKMPPGDGKKLEPALIATVRDWVDAGAPFVQKEAAQKWDYKEEDLWAFRPVRKPTPPPIARNPIDAFLLAALQQHGLQPAPKADRRTLIRRAALDLTGLPPTPEEIEIFVNDRSPSAYENLVDRLLTSPRYGERWGRHWLDVVRYADSSGYSNDFERPNAWRYRDYVIRSFNADKPYDRFIREQIAGDELDAANPENLIATGFLRAGPWEHTGMAVAAVTRQMFLDDVTHAVASTFLGLTLGCARCHDHKFDPIPTADYYSMQAIFAATEFSRRPAPFLPSENTANLDRERARIQAIFDRTKQKMDEFDERVKQHVMRKHGVSRVEDLPEGVLQAALRKKEGITPEEYELFKLYQKHVQLYRDSLDRFEPKAFGIVNGILPGTEDSGPDGARPRNTGPYEPPATHVLVGGDIQAPADRVQPAVLSAVTRYSELPAPEIPETLTGRRTALADWIADPRNPLTSRVIVNRIWQYHFGRGIVADASNFGKMGKKPTHPELLDWLAAAFLENGWSVKKMHRLILLSDAYQRASTHPDMPAVRRADPENNLLAFYPPRRVEAEVLRDSILAAAGELNREAGGPGTFPQMNEDFARQPRHAMGSLRPAYMPSLRRSDRNRRTIYTFQQRSMVDPMVEVFNGPSLDFSCERREATTVPTQAFALFNGEVVHDMALAFALRLEREERSTAARVRRAFRIAYGRAPTDEEERLALDHVERMTGLHRHAPPTARATRKPVVHTITSELTGENFRFVQDLDWSGYEENPHPSDTSPETRALADLALVLFNSNEFVYVY